jgi:RND family efflux transporter MFP subunit
MNLSPSSEIPVAANFPQAQPPAGRSGPRRTWPRVFALGGLAAVALATALVAGTVPRVRQQSAVNAEAAAVANSPPRVTVVTARSAAAENERVLPGNALPLLDAAIYARTTGYLKKRLVDIGDRVEEGQLLAEIAAPDIDDQLAQAKANLVQSKSNLQLAKANAELAKVNLDRDMQLFSNAAVSQQQIDIDTATAKSTIAQVDADKAMIQVNEAAVQRYSDLQGFQKIVAPFPGVITARNVDPGDLISADTPNTSKEMFHLMRTDILRVFVNVPQVFSTGIQVGQNAVVYQRDQPQRMFAGKVTRTADALDANTRTLLTEVQVPNPDNTLRPGMYLQVKFVFTSATQSIRIPAAAIVVRNGPRKVAVLDAQNAVHYRDVDLGRDFGNEIEVLTGLQAGDKVVVHPGDDIAEGTVVEPVYASAPGNQRGGG